MEQQSQRRAVNPLGCRALLGVPLLGTHLLVAEQRAAARKSKLKTLPNRTKKSQNFLIWNAKIMLVLFTHYLALFCR